MPTNPYFSSNYFATAKDQALLNSLSREQIQIYGIDCYYIPRKLVNYDKLFGEDQSSNFESAYTIELMVKSIDSFGGDGKFLSKFGLEIQDEMTFTVHRGRFAQEVLANEPSMSRPMEGDLIAVQSAIDKRQRVFEISYVNSEEFFYQQGNLYTWEIRVRNFSLGGETFDTGISEIDEINDYAINKVVYFNTGGGDFEIGETVTISGTSDTAEVVMWDNTNELKKLVMTKVKGEWDAGEVVGMSSGAIWLIEKSDGESSRDPAVVSDTDFIKTKEIDIIDFSERNPFSLSNNEF